MSPNTAGVFLEDPKAVAEQSCPDRVMEPFDQQIRSCLLTAEHVCNARKRKCVVP